MFLSWRTVITALVFASTVSTTHGTIYYLSPSGSDANQGTSTATAWKTALAASRTTFRAGDQLLFEGGHTYRGRLELGGDDAGLPDAPIVVGSYGKGRATIDGGNGSGLIVDGSSWITVRDLNVVGSGRKTGNEQGIGIHLAKGRHIRVDQAETQGFQKAGILIDGCSDVRITRAYAHDNGFAGICADGERSEDIYVGRCRAINNPGDPTNLKNHSGNGIVLFNLSRATIEYCEAAENGWDMPRTGNGPVGIWCASNADRVLIQFCISHHNKSPGLDGGGFDFDGGVTNSVMQYNYSHHNKSWGYLLYDYGSAWPFRNNTIRYCISENDGDAGIGVGVSETAPNGFSDCEIYGNTIRSTAETPCVFLFQGNPKDFRFRNNLFISKTGPQVRGASHALFEGNCYWGKGGEFKVDDYSNLNAWADATGQETIDGKIVGVHLDPRFEESDGKCLTDPEQLHTLTGYQLRTDSPLIDKGVDLTTRLSGVPAIRDFFGRRVPLGAGYDIGVSENP